MKRNYVYLSSLYVFGCLLLASLSTSCSEVEPSGEGGCELSGFEAADQEIISGLLAANCASETKSWSVSNVSQEGSTRNAEIKANWAGFKLTLRADVIDGKSALYYQAELPEGISNPTDADIDKVWPEKGYIVLDAVNADNKQITIKRHNEDKSSADDAFSNATITFSEDNSSITIAFTITTGSGSSRSLGVANGQWAFTLTSS